MNTDITKLKITKRKKNSIKNNRNQQKQELSKQFEIRRNLKQITQQERLKFSFFVSLQEQEEEGLMNIFKSWKVKSSVQKAQKLWNEFKQVSHLKDDPETIKKLKKFLDFVQQSLKEFLEKNRNSGKQIDEIVGEASDILKNLLQFVSDYDKTGESNSAATNEIVNQVLEIAEMILRDPKYKKQIENSHSILNDFLNVADKLDKSESKVTVVKLIIMLAESVDSKMSFVQNEGFAKLMKLLMDKDERVSRIISRALLHFLQIDNSEESRFINEMQAEIQEKEEFVSIKTKIKKIALDFRKFTFLEIQRLFLQNESTPQQIGGHDNLIEGDPHITENNVPHQSSSHSFSSEKNYVLQNDMSQFGQPPSYEEIFETDLRTLIAMQISKESGISEGSSTGNIQNGQNNNNPLEHSINQNQQGNSKKKQLNLQLQRVPSCPGSFSSEELEEHKFHSCGGGKPPKSPSNSNDTNSEKSEEVTILQGGFKAILETLQISNEKIQLNLMQTICKLLNGDDPKCKVEFKRLEGYTVIGSLFNRNRDYNQESSRVFVASMMNVFIDVVVPDKQRHQISNFDAFEVLMHLISAGSQFEIIALALDSIRNILVSNWKNLLIARRLKLSYHLLALSMRLFQGGSDSPGNSALSIETAQQTQEDQLEGKEKNKIKEESIFEMLGEVYKTNNQQYYASEITHKNEQIGQHKLEELLTRVSQTFKIFSFVEGAFSTELEHAFSEIILHCISSPNQKRVTVFFLDQLIEFFDKKQSRKCSKIFTFDTSFLPFIDCLKQIIELLFQRITGHQNIICLTQEESAHYLAKFLFFGEKCLSCDHSKQVQNEERMKQLEKENTLIKHIICRNQCEETKNSIEKFVAKLSEREETRLSIQVIQLKQVSFSEYNFNVLRVLKDIFISNPTRAQQFFTNEGLSIITYVASQIIESDQSFLGLFCMLFIDLCLGRNNSEILLQNSVLQLNDSKLPLMIEGRRGQVLNAMFSSISNTKFNDSHFPFFEQLSRLLLQADNLRAFKMESYSLSFLLDILCSGKITSANNNLYTQVLSLLERFVPRLTSSDVKQVLDSLLSSQNLKNLGSKRQDTAFFTDILSILSIHMLLRTNALLLEKIISEKYILSLFGFLDSPQPEIREMVLKFIICSMSVYSKTKKKEGYGKKEQYFYLLGQKLLAGRISKNICKILYDFTFWEESPSIMYPYNSSVVSTLFNRSEQANLLMQKATSDQQKQSKLITNVDMLEIFFKVLKAYDGDDSSQENALTFHNEMLNVFEAVLDEPANLLALLDQPNFLNWFYVILPNTWKSQEQSLHKQYSLNEERNASNGGSEGENSSRRDSSRDYVRQGTSEPNNQLKLQKEKVFSIIQKILQQSFHKKGGDFQEQMRRFIHNDEDFLTVIVRNYFKDLLQNCIVKDDPPQNFLKKLKDFEDNVDSLTGFDSEISILILQCIIRMAAKNSPHIRQLMKELKFFEKRDSLIIRILTYDLDGGTFIKVFEGIPFDTLSNLKEFQDKHALSSIMKILVEKQNCFPLQMLIISIFKNPALSEKNQKYIAELLEYPKLIQFFYSSFPRRKAGSLAKCLQSNLNNSNGNSNKFSGNEEENKEDLESDEHEEEEEEAHRKQTSQRSHHMGASFDDFLHSFYSESSSDLRKQIMLRVNVNLTPVLKQYEIEEKKIKKKRDESKLKFQEAFEKDLQLAQIKLSDLELEISKKLKTSTDDCYKKQKEFSDFVEKKLSEGQVLFEKINTQYLGG